MGSCKDLIKLHRYRQVLKSLNPLVSTKSHRFLKSWHCEMAMQRSSCLQQANSEFNQPLKSFHFIFVASVVYYVHRKKIKPYENAIVNPRLLYSRQCQYLVIVSFREQKLIMWQSYIRHGIVTVYTGLNSWLMSIRQAQRYLGKCMNQKEGHQGIEWGKKDH